MNWRLCAVTAGGLGLIKPGPGTWGSLPPAMLAGLFGTLGQGPVVLLMLCGLVIGSACSVMLAPWYQGFFKRPDPSSVVCDEVAGMSLCMMLLPWPSPSLTIWAQVGIAFVAFRLFDIVKPPPIRGSQNLAGGWGVLIDDLMAGVAAAAVVWILILSV